MPIIRVLFLWHMHQPFYKDLVTGQYRLPWVRLHALKDYYGMVKLLDEFPDVHQTFNLVPSLVAQIEDYVSGTARDPFLEIAAKPARDLSLDERRFALGYLFQANSVNMIARYPRYNQLLGKFRGMGENAERAAAQFDAQDFADLQVLSQLAWFDEFFLPEPELAALVRKGAGFNEDDQRFVISRQKDLMAKVLPAYAAAAAKGAIELSTSPFYHPILPLLCDSNVGAVSSPGLKLPQKHFLHPEDAHTQIERGLQLHARVFGMPPRGLWPSEGGVSEQVLEIAHRLGLQWVATDEGVLGRSTNFNFLRDGSGALLGEGADRLYRLYRYEKGETQMYLVFRDHALSDLIGFVYSNMPPHEAASDLISKIKAGAQPVLRQGRDAIVSVILDGENAWEYYPRSGREFLRRLYDAIQRDPEIQAVTISEAISGQRIAPLNAARAAASRSQPLKTEPKGAEQGTVAAISPEDLTPPALEVAERRRFARLDSLVPGSWINANFNVWIGAPEDNRAWDYLAAAREFYANHGITATDEQRALAFEEILIAEGSDWNWWYGPEHHTANDRDFDELYRKHLSNVYLALGARPPDYLAQPIAVEAVRPSYSPQTAYIRPRIMAEYERYFDWIGAAMYAADRRAGAMHGKQFLLDSIHAGIDESNVYGRLDFISMPEGDFEVRVNFECERPEAVTALTLEVLVQAGKLAGWKLRKTDSAVVLAVMNGARPVDLDLRLRRNFAFRLALSQLEAAPGAILRLRFSLWRQRLPLDALPLEGWLELRVAAEEELEAGISQYSVHS
jgi:alpha-amylase/alpha-mannosidase (GH57 family)